MSENEQAEHMKHWLNFKSNEKKWFYERRVRFNLGPTECKTVGPKEPKEKKYPDYFIQRLCDEKIKAWLERTKRGTLLITGYRGVGKSIVDPMSRTIILTNKVYCVPV